VNEVTIDNRKYRATNFRTIQNDKKYADVEFYYESLGWRECKNWDRNVEVATLLWAHKDEFSFEEDGQLILF
jgi:hypothetical protein